MPSRGERLVALLARSLRRASTFAIAPSLTGQPVSPGSPIGTASAYVGIGANLGDRAETIAAAVELLAAEQGVEVVAVSTLRETDPVGWEDQPRFLNAAALVETELPSRTLLERLLEIEARLGRTRGVGPRFGPRTIDLDLLLYGDETIDEPGLSVPHPRLHERRFALEPLAELDPALEVPGRGPVQALLAGL